MRNEEYEKKTTPMLVIGAGILLFNMAYYIYPMAYHMGLTNKFIYTLFEQMATGGMFKTPFRTKFWAYLITIVGAMIRVGGNPTKKSVLHIIALCLIGTTLYFISPRDIIFYALTTVAGYIISFIGFAHLSKLDIPGLHKLNDEDTFPQEKKKIENQYSLNFETRFHWKGKWQKGWVNVINPFRMIMVEGAPGSGKSYSIFEPAFFQLIKKKYSMFCYDLKYPAETEVVYGLWKKYKHTYPVEPEFHVINFKDPRFSERCNPINPKFLNDPSDASEIAEIVMTNVNKGATNDQKFFTDSAKLYLDALVWFLRKYEDGKYCTFPHVIELMTSNYRHVFEIMKERDDLKGKIKTFTDQIANSGGSMETLMSQISSAQVPLGKFVSPKLYWVLSGDDVELDINNPEAPKILCLGNDPDNQNIYGTASSLLTSRLVKTINKPGKVPCVLSLDELSSIVFMGLDILAQSARSNKVTILAGIQTVAQLIRDYKKEEARVIEENMGNFFFGATTGEAAQNISKMFGKQKIENQSISSGDNLSVSISYKEEDRLPASRIESLHNGMFCGKVADEFNTPFEHPFFCGKFIRNKQEIEEMKTFEKMPPFNDFGEKEIRRRVEENKREYLYKYVRPKALQKYRDNGGLVIDETIIEQYCTEFINEVPQKEQDRIIKEETQRLVNQAVEDELNATFQRIQSDIKQLVDKEYNRIMDERQLEKEAQMRREKDAKIDKEAKQYEMPEDIE